MNGMTLREAVEIDRKCNDDSGMGVRIGRENMAEWHRARAIVDAAVDVHEARSRQRDAFQNRPNGSLEDVRRFMHEWYQAVQMAEDRLSALERGEEVK